MSEYKLTTNANNISNTISQIKECFAGPARADFQQVITQANTDKDTLGEELWEFTEEMLPKNAADEQATYLRSTKKPMKLTAKEWIKRIQVINSHMGLMSKEATEMSKQELVKQVIKPNIPRQVATKFEIEYRSGMSLKEVSRILGLLLKDANETSNRKSVQQRSGRSNFSGRNNFRNNRNRNGSNNENGEQHNRGRSNRGRNRDKENHHTSRSNRNDDRNRSPESNASSNRGSEYEEGYGIDEEKRNDKKTKKRENTMGAEIILSLPNETKGGEKILRGLLDSGTSASLINDTKVPKSVKRRNKMATSWNTKGGKFETFARSLISGLQFPQFTTRRSFEHEFHVFKNEQNEKYDVIIGRDLMQNLGIDIMYSRRTFQWDDIKIPMMPMGYWEQHRIEKFMACTREGKKSELVPVAEECNKSSKF